MLPVIQSNKDNILSVVI